MPADKKYGSIVSLIGRDRVYGIRAILTLPRKYKVYDKEQFKSVIALDAKAKLHHYFDAYFSLCGDVSGEDARVEAGIFKYSGEDSINWQAARGGIGSANFHRDIHAENAFPNNRLAIETSFAPNDRMKVALKINHQITQLVIWSTIFHHLRIPTTREVCIPRCPSVCAAIITTFNLRKLLSVTFKFAIVKR